MSHYAVNYGSGLYGVSAESLLGMDVIVASGDMISTGSGGGVGSSPFFRFYGPDLTGLFVGDAGALGVKARMTLRLIRKPEGFAACSFGFPDGESALRAMMAVARLNVCAQNFGLDPRQQKTALTRMESASAAGGCQVRVPLGAQSGGRRAAGHAHGPRRAEFPDARRCTRRTSAPRG